MADLQIQFAHPWTHPETGVSYSTGQLATFDEDLSRRLLYNGYASLPSGATPPLIGPGNVDDVELGFALAGVESKISRASANPGFMVVLGDDGQTLQLVANAGGSGGGGGTPVSDATGSVKGVVALAGDLGGTAAAPTVPGLASKLDLEQVQDAVATMIVAGTNMTKVYNDTTGTLTLSSAGGTGGTVTDPEVVRDTIAAALVAGTGITIAQNDASDTITISATGTGGATDQEVVRDTIATALVAGANVTITPNDAGDTITIAATTGGGGGGTLDLVDGGGPTSTYATPEDQLERIRDTVAAALVAGPGMIVTVNDASDTITLSSTGSTDPEIVRDTMAAALVAGPGVTIVPNDAGDTITVSATVDTEVVRDTIGSALVAGTGISVTPNDAGDTITITATGAGVDAEAVRDIVGTALIGSGSVTVTANDAGDTITVGSTATTNSADSYLRDRVNHTGTQAASTISDLAATVKALVNAAGTPSNPHTNPAAARNNDLTVNYWDCWPSTPAAATSRDQILVPADGQSGGSGTYLQQFAGTDGSWTNSGSTSTVAYSTDRFSSSPGSLKVTGGADSTLPIRAASPRIAPTPGTRYTVTARLSTAAASNRSVSLLYRVYNSSLVEIGQGVGSQLTANTILAGTEFTFMSWSFTLTSNADAWWMDLQFTFAGALAAGEVFYIDDVTVG